MGRNHQKDALTDLVEAVQQLPKPEPIQKPSTVRLDDGSIVILGHKPQAKPFSSHAKKD